MRTNLSNILIKLADYDKNIVLITNDVNFPNIDLFQNKYHNRFFNMGICEQSTISLAAGLSLSGLYPIVYTITPFLIERTFEQIKIDIDYNNLPILFIGFDDYPTYGITHNTPHIEKIIDIFKNIKGYYPRTQEEVEKYILDAYLSKIPSLIALKKIGLPYLPPK